MGSHKAVDRDDAHPPGDIDDYIDFAEAAAPAAPASGFGRLYVQTDGKIYFKDDVGAEYDLTAGSSGSGTTEAARIYLTSDFNPAGGTWDVIEFDAEFWDLSGNLVDLANFGFTIPAGEGGVYMVTCALEQESASALVQVRVTIDGIAEEGFITKLSASDGDRAIGAMPIEAAAGETVRLEVNDAANVLIRGEASGFGMSWCSLSKI